MKAFVTGVSTVDARDVAAAMIKAVQHGRNTEKYIVAGRMAKFADIFKILEQVSGVKAPTRQLPNWLVLVLARVDTLIANTQKKTPTLPLDGVRTMLELKSLSSNKAQVDLGITFRPLEQTLQDTVQWYKEKGYTQ